MEHVSEVDQTSQMCCVAADVCPVGGTPGMRCLNVIGRESWDWEDAHGLASLGPPPPPSGGKKPSPMRVPPRPKPGVSLTQWLNNYYY